jgi:hypothetical protein
LFVAPFLIKHLLEKITSRFSSSVFHSVADPGCLYRIPDPTTATKEDLLFNKLSLSSQKLWKIWVWDLGSEKTFF